jgi:hypothetical protein
MMSKAKIRVQKTRSNRGSLIDRLMTDGYDHRPRVTMSHNQQRASALSGCHARL